MFKQGSLGLTSVTTVCHCWLIQCTISHPGTHLCVKTWGWDGGVDKNDMKLYTYKVSGVLSVCDDEKLKINDTIEAVQNSSLNNLHYNLKSLRTFQLYYIYSIIPSQKKASHQLFKDNSLDLYQLASFSVMK